MHVGMFNFTPGTGFVLVEATETEGTEAANSVFARGNGPVFGGMCTNEADFFSTTILVISHSKVDFVPGSTE